MNKVENKKGKKRPFGETQSVKLGKKQENISGFKKDFKKPKLAISTQNGDFKAENKAKSFKVANKQKQHKNVKQSDNTMPSHLKEKIVPAQSFKTKEKKIDGSKKTKLSKEKQQQQQQQSPSQNKSPKKEYTIEHLEQRIKEIEGRENLSKTAKRKLSFYKKLLVKKTEGKESVTEKKNIQTNKQISKNVQLNKKKVIDKSKAKPKSLIETKHKAEEKEDEDDDDDEDTDDDFDDDSDNYAGLSDLGEEEEEDEEGEEEGGEEEEDSEEDKEFEEVDEEEEESEDELTMNLLNNDDEDESDDEITSTTSDGESDEEDDETDTDTDTDDESDEITEAVMQSPKKKEDSPKKNEYSLFVKNLPNDAMENDIKQHFLKTVSKVISVTKNKNFAIVELANKTEYEKGLSLNQTKFKGKMISVQQYIPKKPIPTKRTDDPKNEKYPKKKLTLREELKMLEQERKRKINN